MSIFNEPPIEVEVKKPENSKKVTRRTVKTSQVKCTNCSRILGDLIEADPKLANDIEQKHIFICPCGGESFVVKVQYTAFFLSAEGLITSSIQEIGSNKFKSILEIYNE
jgi:hypothetical protein